MHLSLLLIMVERSGGSSKANRSPNHPCSSLKTQMEENDTNLGKGECHEAMCVLTRAR
jgi:hypothetical protein